ncbi:MULTISPECIES: DUF1569 domain-containing protein [Chryseobacterium]|uniref:DUF1569 domain-containing protein n=1 Tax=Chryseobacterium camelliae TaxID=1265445 RepID=A0ABU0TGS9_9FLAO|nr:MULTISPECIES: DUF1569 domain-containing protein [Chryseobacterium]MDT3405926.1 hypothetical protein [Pseudacidovorax intermedius]MDQ1096270.1 hypothetical protein [Chryseobacterium camelliae]MDQ1100207.1 hypothetical protein [Chryseobacterium sp. SORGH_AS_1048]MDR6087552.1 hypothetical protein [Chryseobacterium sp. SORGH_AS_0909]MDR6131926.1 hypothetical protein [Chryseobacterium sp. SORGH_AS_1175]
MLVNKSLHDPACFGELVRRISYIREDAQAQWGKMDVCQMMKHCDLVLQIPLNKINLPEINLFFRMVGIATKKEMKIFNNGIPRNMPTFQKLIVNFECDFKESKESLLNTMREYLNAYEKQRLPARHVLFGNMTAEDWGFLEFKHLDHHLKQFNV